MSPGEVRRGEVWLADIPNDKLRPVLVMTRNSVLPRLSTILVAPVTTRVRNIPTEVTLGLRHGLSRDCVANFDNLVPLPKEALVRRLGQLDRTELSEACIAARFSIGC